jgi:hypothetical protein
MAPQWLGGTHVLELYYQLVHVLCLLACSCNKACQRAAWPQHKVKCKETQAYRALVKVGDGTAVAVVVLGGLPSMAATASLSFPCLLNYHFLWKVRVEQHPLLLLTVEQLLEDSYRYLLYLQQDVSVPVPVLGGEREQGGQGQALFTRSTLMSTACRLTAWGRLVSSMTSG